MFGGIPSRSIIMVLPMWAVTEDSADFLFRNPENTKNESPVRGKIFLKMKQIAQSPAF